MTGIRERITAPIHAPEANGVDVDSALFSLEDDFTNRPNDSYELREMVVVASAYLGQGMVEDADELLREVLDAGYSRTDALDLRARIDFLRADNQCAEPPSVDPALATSPRRRIAFTNPLPGAERLPIEMQRLIRESDADLREGRIHAAFDAALYVIGSVPNYYPMFVRLAEIELAQGKIEPAAALTRTLTLHARDTDSQHDWMLYPLRLALAEDDLDTLVEYARHLLAHPGLSALEPFVPNAISALLESDPGSAQELARDYARAMPHNDDALRLLIKASIASSDRDALFATITGNVRSDSALDLLLFRSAVGAQRNRDEWGEWLERAVERMADSVGNVDMIESALELYARMVPPARAHLTAAVTQLAAGQLLAAREASARWQRGLGDRTVDRRDQFIALAADALAADALDASDALESYVEAARNAIRPEVHGVAEATRLFVQPAGAAALLSRVTAIAMAQAREEDAIQSLRNIRDENPDSLEVRDALATLCLRRERIAEGVRELRFIAERRDEAGDVYGMVDALRRMSDALPNNAEVKSKIAESLLQRGMLEDAMRELEILGDLLSARGSTADAVSTYTRGAEVAAAIGNFKRATEFLDRAVLAEPESDAVRHAAVAFYLRIGAIDRAVRQLWEVVRIASTADDPDEAVAALHQIIALTPNDPAAYHKLGEVLASLGEYAQSEKVYRRLAVLTPDDPVLVAKQAALSALAATR